MGAVETVRDRDWIRTIQNIENIEGRFQTVQRPFVPHRCIKGDMSWQTCAVGGIGAQSAAVESLARDPVMLTGIGDARIRCLDLNVI